ncbi:helix-turn-helix domain-containing protein [Chryseobacterium oranimense]|uniref:helix-turn-helix domain-containing protein n=1 Tax=Chryseobacterium oranimense TaxID=421058 RepID=UPI0018ECD07B
MSFGTKIRELREAKKMLQRELAAKLDIDTPMFSKIERGERQAKREQVILLAELLDSSQEDFLSVWLADKLYEVLKGEPTATIALDLTKYELSKRKK